MTLALTAKSRQRRFSLILAAILALIGAVLAGIAARDTVPAAASQPIFSIDTLAVQDYAAPDGVVRHGELVRVDFSITLHQSPADAEFTVSGVPAGTSAFAAFEPTGLANNLACDWSSQGFSCGEDGAEPGSYGGVLLLRSQATCFDGALGVIFTISHPGIDGEAEMFATEQLTIDCALPEVSGAEINIDVRPWSGSADSTLFRIVAETPPSEPSERDILAGQTATFAVATGGQHGSLATLVLPAGGWSIHSVECWGLGDAFSMAANQLQFYLKNGYVMNCIFFMERPGVLIDRCDEGEVGALASGARWGFSAEGITPSMVVAENQVIPTHPDHPAPFDLDDLVAMSGQGWQWSNPIVWDADRDTLLVWRLQIESLPLLAVIIDTPAEARVTPYNLCPGQPLAASFNVCSHFLPDDAASIETFDFTYIVNGELAAEMDIMEGDSGCVPVQMGLNDLDVVVNLSQLTQPEWEHRAGYPTRAIAYQDDPPPATTMGSEVAFKFHWINSLNTFGCYELGQLPAADFPCVIDFYNARPISEVEEFVSLSICNHSTDETGLNAPAVFQYRVNGQFVPASIDSTGGSQYCLPAYVPVNEAVEPIVVEQVTPSSWTQAQGWPRRRVIHYQDNPQATLPGGSVLVQFATGKGGELVCYEPGIEAFAPLGPLPGTGLACHVVFENVRIEPPATPTPTATSTATTTSTPTPTATATVPPDDPTATPTAPSATPTGNSSPVPTGQPDTPSAPTTPAEPGVPASPNTNGGNPPVTTQPSSPGNGQTPAPEETVAGEQAPGGATTPIAPSTGESRELAGARASVWAVVACFLFAASIAFTTVAIWQKDRQR